jgi:DNA-binding transcriptional LysR family regulator
VGVQLDAALRGVGIALLPRGLVKSQLLDGRLHSLLENTLGGPIPANLVFVDREFSPPQLRAFIERAVEYFRTWAPS